jgi:CRP-like cAMP-binding protein
MRLTAAVEDVARIRIFAGLPTAALQEWTERAVRRPLAKRESIFHQGDRPARLHALASGWVRILQAGADGEQSVIRLVGPGELFGAFAMFTDAGYPADATAAEDSLELSWSEAHVRELMGRHPSIAVDLLAVAARRLLELQERVREISTQRAEQRIASALLRLARRAGERHSDGSVDILAPLVRKDIAAVSRTTLYTASRTMSQWQRAGIVASRRGRIAISSPEKLKRIADGE